MSERLLIGREAWAWTLAGGGGRGRRAGTGEGTVNDDRGDYGGAIATGVDGAEAEVVGVGEGGGGGRRRALRLS